MLWTRTGGRNGGALLVLLHGLGATGDVWRGLEQVLPGVWPGSWLVVDLAGHGRSPWTGDYRIGAHAEQVAELVPDGPDVVVLGHSLGGMVGLAVAGQLRRPPVAVIGFSVKTSWPAEQLAGMRALAARTPKRLPDERSAKQLYRRAAGLDGLVDLEDPALDAGVVQARDGWRLAQDPQTFDFGAPDVQALLDGSRMTVVTLARGSADRMVPREDVELVEEPVTFDGLGHNPHVEQPEALLPLLRRSLR